MPSKEVVFIHHSLCDGKLSQDNARKVWSHVSRRSWQKKPKQMTITIWKPPRRLSGQHRSRPRNEREAIIIPYSNLQKAYLSKKCLEYLRPPEGLAMLETTLFVVCEHAIKASTLEQSGLYAKDEAVLVKSRLHDWGFSVKCGSVNLLNRNVAQAFASFEFASRLLKTCLSEKCPHLFSSILVTLAYAQSRNSHDVVQLFLKQIAALATTSYGPRHPISIWAQNILTIGIHPTLVENLFVAENNAACSAGFLDRYEADQGLFDLKCDVFRASYDIHEAEETYRDLIDRSSTFQSPYVPNSQRYTCQWTSVIMAQLYLEHRSYSKAASVLSDAHADLEEYVSEGWVPTMPVTAPVSMIMIVWRLYVLGQALAGQGHHESANAAFTSAVATGLKYLDHDHHINISAQKAYSEYLSSQNRKVEADEIERIVDLRLDMYKLSLSNDE